MPRAGKTAEPIATVDRDANGRPRIHITSRLCELVEGITEAEAAEMLEWAWTQVDMAACVYAAVTSAYPKLRSANRG